MAAEDRDYPQGERMIRRIGLALISTSLYVALTACGGGGSSSGYTNSSNSGNSGNTPPPPPALSITTTSLPSTFEGSTYAATLRATGGTGTYTWKAGSPFPTWLALDSSTGVLSGTPPVRDPAYTGYGVSLQVAVTDSASPAQSASASLYFDVRGVITMLMMPANGTINVPYSFTSWLNGGQPPFTATAISGLPPGLTVLSDNVNPQHQVSIQGTPTQSGAYTLQLQITDSESPAQQIVVPLNLSFDSKLTILNNELKLGVAGRAFSDQLIAVNGTLPLTWISLSLPDGLTLDPSTGKITGTPPVSQTGTTGGLAVQVTDSSSPPQTLMKGMNFTFFSALEFIAPSSLQTNLNSQFRQSLVTYGGFPPTTISSTGNLPPGLSLDEHGLLFGTPAQLGSYTFTVTATDSDTPPVTIQNTFTISVLPPLPVLTYVPLPNAYLARPYSGKMYARDGTLPYHWAIASGQLPPGLSMDSDGNITGTPTTLPVNDNAFRFTVSVTDSASPPQTATSANFINVFAASKGRNDSIATATPVSYGLDASFSPFDDPPGSTASAPDSDYYRLIANAGSVVTISANAGGQTDPVLEILDANGQRYTTCKDPGDDHPTLTFIVKDTTPDAFDDECLDDDVDPTVNRNASLQFQVPGAAGTQLTFYVHAFDSSGNARPDLTYRLDLSSNVVRPLIVSSLPPFTATVGTLASIQVQFDASGGTSPYTWQLASGALPPGLQLANVPINGWMIQGTPTTAGTYNFVLQVTDAGNPAQTGTAAFTIIIH